MRASTLTLVMLSVAMYGTPEPLHDVNEYTCIEMRG
jgi:hypothetical protein